MNLFRSEEHARNWPGYDEGMSHLLKPLEDWAEVFSNPFFTERGRHDYITWLTGDQGQAAFGALRAALSP